MGSMIIGPAVRWAKHYIPVGRGSTNITTVNNNYCSSCSGGYSGGGSGWLGSLLMGLPMLGMMFMNFIPMFRGAGNNGAQQQQQPDPDLQNLEKLYGANYNITHNTDGTFTAVSRTNDKLRYEGADFNALKEAISNASESESAARAQQNEDAISEEQALNNLEDKGLGDKIKVEDGKIKYTDPEDNAEKEVQLTMSNLSKVISRFIAKEPYAPQDNVENNEALTQDSLNKQLKKAKIPENSITFNQEKNEISYKGKDGKTVTVAATKENIAAAIRTLIPAAKPTNTEGATWKHHKDSWLSGDAQFVTADGKKTFEILEASSWKKYPDHLNVDKFDIEDGKSIKLKEGYAPSKIVLVNTDAHTNNPGVLYDGVKQEFECYKKEDGTIMVKVGDNEIKLEDFLMSSDYVVKK